MSFEARRMFSSKWPKISSSMTRKTRLNEMKKIIIEVRDDAPMGKALEGTIKLVSETEGVFTEWRRSIGEKSTKVKRVFKKLVHGRVSASENDVRLTLRIDRSEYRVDAETITQVLEMDCSDACATTEIWEEGGIL